MPWNYDIIGVCYKLYSNGYAEFDSILNPYCLLLETITHEGKEYTVVKTALHSGGASHGMFGVNGKIDAPENLVIPNTITEIPSYAFHGCSSSTIARLDNVTYVSGSAFSQCSNKEPVEFSDSLEKLSVNHLFCGCTSLKP